MPAWTEGYQGITTTTLTGEDFIAELAAKTVARDAEFRKSIMSSAWSMGKKKATDPRGRVFDLLRIKNCVHSIVKIHGAPPRTSVTIASIGEGASGMAGYEDPVNRKHPFILLDTAIYDKCDGSEMIDAYCGLGIHEAEHLLSSIEFTDNAKKLPQEALSWLNLLEDERIENLARERSPGYAPYIHAVKRVVFEKDELAPRAKNWDELPDIDKIRLLIFLSIRCPHVLTSEMISWETVRGVPVFDELRKILPKTPTTETEVYLGAKAVHEFMHSLEEDYDDLSKMDDSDLSDSLGCATDCTDDHDETEKSATDTDSSGDSPTDDEPSGDGGKAPGGSKPASESAHGSDCTPSEDDGGTASGGDIIPGAGSGSEKKTTLPADERGGKTSSETADDKGTKTAKERSLTEALDEAKRRLAKHRESLEHDKKIAEDRTDLELKLKRLHDRMRKLDSTEEVTKALKDGTITGEVADAAAELEKTKKALSDLLTGTYDEFTKDDLARIIKIIHVVGSELKLTESIAMAEAVEERIEMSETTDSTVGSIERLTMVTHPKVTPKTKNKYKLVMGHVRPYIKRCRTALQFRMGEKVFDERQQIEGRLDRRMLSRSKVTDRIFKQLTVQKASGLAICLLLDESGSMGEADEFSLRPTASKLNPASTALTIAVMFAEALKGVPGIELEIYSYSSFGGSDEHNLIKYLYGKNQPHLESITGYGDGQQNYDHLAIKGAGKLFIENTTNPHRLMLVLSDGAPCGHCYSGKAAEKATRDVVKQLEKQMAIVQVAITRFDSESMFSNVIRFLDLSTLVNDMRKLLIKTIRAVS